MVQEILIPLEGIGLYFVSELKKLFENLNCIYGLLCQPVVAISFETLSGVDFVKCNKEYFKYWELGKTISVVCQVLFHQFLTPIFLKRHLIHTYFLLLYFLTHQNVIFQEPFDVYDTFGLLSSFFKTGSNVSQGDRRGKKMLEF